MINHVRLHERKALTTLAPPARTAMLCHQAVECAWALIKQRVPTVFGWLSRDPVVGSDDDAKMTENLFKHVFFE